MCRTIVALCLALGLSTTRGAAPLLDVPSAAAAAAAALPTLYPILRAGTYGHHCFRVPGAVTAPSGALLVFVEARGADCGDNTPKDVMLTRSTDGGVSWSPPMVVMAGYSIGTNHTYRNPTPVFTIDGTLVLQFVNTTVLQWRSLQMTSRDEGLTWSAPSDPRLGAADSLLAGPSNGLRLSARSPAPGRLLFCGTNCYDPSAPRSRVGARVWSSDNGGRSWASPDATFKPLMCECAMAELSNGSVLMNFRANHEDAACACRAQARSDDGGATFGALAFVDALVEPVCSAGLLNTPQGLYFSNPASRTERVNMTVRKSDDGGATWPTSVQIWPAGSAYSTLIPVGARGVGIIFETMDATGYNSLMCECCLPCQRGPEHSVGSLNAACAEGNVARVRSLLKHLGAAADVDEALTHAASGGHVRVVAALCDAGAHADGAALLKAVTHTLKALPADAPAALARSVAVATELLRRGAPTAGSCALRFACQAGAHELVALLLEHGADVNEAGEHDGVTALMVAAEHAVPATITLLLAAGANPHASSDDCGWSPLHYACADTTQAGNLDVVRALLEGGADSNAASFTGSTPLWIASQNGRADCVLLLCESGADPRASKSNGLARFSCLDIAQLHGHSGTATVLRRFGAR